MTAPTVSALSREAVIAEKDRALRLAYDLLTLMCENENEVSRDRKDARDKMLAAWSLEVPALLSPSTTSPYPVSQAVAGTVQDSWSCAGGREVLWRTSTGNSTACDLAPGTTIYLHPAPPAIAREVDEYFFRKAWEDWFSPDVQVALSAEARAAAALAALHTQEGEGT